MQDTSQRGDQKILQRTSARHKLMVVANRMGQLQAQLEQDKDLRAIK